MDRSEFKSMNCWTGGDVIKDAFHSHMENIKNCDAEILDYVEELEGKIKGLEEHISHLANQLVEMNKELIDAMKNVRLIDG